MDNVREHNNCTNLPSSQTFRSCLHCAAWQSHITCFRQPTNVTGKMCKTFPYLCLIYIETIQRNFNTVVFCGVTSYSLVNGCQYFGGTCCLCLQDNKVRSLLPKIRVFIFTTMGTTYLRTFLHGIKLNMFVYRFKSHQMGHTAKVMT
jgi:hypothetical protein